MALITMLIAGTKRTSIKRIVSGKTVAITLDAALSESFDAQAEATTHPVEDGADITDHVVIKPKKLQIEGIVTNTPLDLAASLQGVIGTITASVGQKLLSNSSSNLAFAGSLGQALAAKTVGSLLGLSNENRMGLIMRELTATRDSKYPVTIQTGLTNYVDYLLIGFQIKRDQSSGQSVSVSLTFQELLKATSLTVKIPVPKTKAGAAQANDGHKTGTDADGQKNTGGSLLFKGLKAAGAVGGG